MIKPTSIRQTKTINSGRTLQYMVKWRGYPDSDNTWESNKDLPKNLIKKFEDAVKLKESEAAADDSDPEPPVKSPKKTPQKRGRPKSKTPAKKVNLIFLLF